MTRQLRDVPENLRIVVLDLDERLKPPYRLSDYADALNVYAKDLFASGVSDDDFGDLLEEGMRHVEEHGYGELRPNDFMRLGVVYGCLRDLAREATEAGRTG